MSSPPRDLSAIDQAHCWHPFTQHAEWGAPDAERLLLVEGSGALLRDSAGREYLDGNSSIWTNLHGHRCARIDQAIRAQLDRVAHTSFLGFTNPPAVLLAAELVAFWPRDTLTRVFFSDDGSTGMEVALKMALQYRQLEGHAERHKCAAFVDAYHGDTLGAANLGGIEAFHRQDPAWQLPVIRVASLEELAAHDPKEIAAVVIEPLVQGAAGIRLWPRGLLADLRKWCDANGVFLIADEVLTGFGRTGTMFACEQEAVIPDFLVLAKGLTGGYLPLAATLTIERVFNAFLGGPERTLYYGHSYSGNQLGCAAALANLATFREEQVLGQLQPKIARLAELVAPLRALPHIFEVRQCGFIVGIEVRQRDGLPFPAGAQTGAKICLAARAHGLLTRPIRDTIVLMPPYCITDPQLTRALSAIAKAIEEVCVCSAARA